MDQIVIGTAGHIDHGKTSLVKALTGTDTDRLKEEQERKITIDLGFAFLDDSIAFVDVPGHEKFVKNMVAGVTGINVSLLVIAADDGIMPQTREHLDILKLLSIKNLVTALTKIDMVEKDWVGLVSEDIRKLLDDNGFIASPIIPVSSVTGEGLGELKTALLSQAQVVEGKNRSTPFRMPVDRSFSMTGFGTVVTGTVVSGELKTTDNVELLPAGVDLKLRGIQSHNQHSENAVEGQRTAINFSGIQKEDINRGDVIALKGYFKASSNLNCSLRYLASVEKPLKFRDRIRFHCGTVEVLGRIILLEKDKVFPGEDTLVQIQLEKLVAAAVSDKYIIRSYSPQITIGGGEILEIDAPRPRKNRNQIAQYVKELGKKSLYEKMAFFIHEHALNVYSTRQICVEFGLFEKDVERFLDKQKTEIKRIDSENERYWLGKKNFENFLSDIMRRLEQFHNTNPEKPSIRRVDITNTFIETIDETLWRTAWDELSRSGKVVLDKDKVRSFDFTAQESEESKVLKSKIVNFINEDISVGPNSSEIATHLDTDINVIERLTRIMIDEGKIVKVDNTFFYSSEQMDNLQSLIKKFIDENGSIAIGDFRTKLNTTRKYALPLLNYFDDIGFTIREGDKRRLR